MGGGKLVDAVFFSPPLGRARSDALFYMTCWMSDEMEPLVVLDLVSSQLSDTPDPYPFSFPTSCPLFLTLSQPLRSLTA